MEAESARFFTICMRVGFPINTHHIHSCHLTIPSKSFNKAAAVSSSSISIPNLMYIGIIGAWWFLGDCQLPADFPPIIYCWCAIFRKPIIEGRGKVFEFAAAT
jgi:hypothetical protein